MERFSYVVSVSVEGKETHQCIDCIVYSACIEFFSLRFLVGILTLKVLENGYHKVESRSYF